jgi:hypothetical protein
MGSDWLGTLPAWFSVGVAFFALLAASTSAFFSFRNTRNQQKQLHYQQVQLRRLDDDERQEQASKVAVWVTTDQPIYKYRIANRSDLPIFDVVVRVDFGHGFGTAEIGSWRVVPPGEKDASLPDRYANIDTLTMSTRPPHIFFTDASGESWLREARGNLRESDEDLWPSFM